MDTCPDSCAIVWCAARSNQADDQAQLTCGATSFRAGAADAEGNVVLVGSAEAGNDFGEGPLSELSGVLLKLDPDGQLLFVDTYAGAAIDDVVVGLR